MNLSTPDTSGASSRNAESAEANPVPHRESTVSGESAGPVVAARDSRPCPKCQGTGEVPGWQSIYNEHVERTVNGVQMESCIECLGSGIILSGQALVRSGQESNAHEPLTGNRVVLAYFPDEEHAVALANFYME